MKIAFEGHFRGTDKRVSTASDLQACVQKKSETSREYLCRWLETRNECENVDDCTTMLAFMGGLQRGGLLRHKLKCEYKDQKLNLDKMISIAITHTATDDDACGELSATALPLHQQKKNRDGNNKRKNPSNDPKSSGSDMVAMTFQRGGQGGGRGRGHGGGAGRASSTLTKSPLPDPALPKPMKSTGICRA
jgi:alanine racemase